MASLKISCMTTKIWMKLRWNVDEASMTAFSLLYVNGMLYVNEVLNSLIFPRFDVPREWPSLLPALSNGIQSSDDLVQHRSLLILHHTIKSLASKRLAADRRVFHELVLQLLPYAIGIWQTHHSALMQKVRKLYRVHFAVNNELKFEIVAQSLFRHNRLRNTEAFYGFFPPSIFRILGIEIWREI